MADVGCGHGASTILMAQAFPSSTFVGFDYHEASIEAARERAPEAGVADRVALRGRGRRRATRGAGYDLVAFFDCLHDMGDPPAPRATSARRWPTTARGCSSSRWPATASRTTSTRSAGSTRRSTLSARRLAAQDGRFALGAQAGEKRIGEVVRAAGFDHFKRVCETPTNLVFEARR